MSENSIENIITSDSNLAPTLLNFYALSYVKFNEHSLENKLPDCGKVINLYISYRLDPWSTDLNTDFTLNNCLFVFVQLTKNAEPDKYVYSAYGIGFNTRSEFSLTDGKVGKNVINSAVDMSSSVHIDKKRKIS